MGLDSQPLMGKILSPWYLNSLFIKYNICSKKANHEQTRPACPPGARVNMLISFCSQLQIKNVPVKPRCGLTDSAAELMFSNMTDRNDTCS